jgi:hypothetical protein
MNKQEEITKIIIDLIALLALVAGVVWFASLLFN